MFIPAAKHIKRID